MHRVDHGDILVAIYQAQNRLANISQWWSMILPAMCCHQDDLMPGKIDAV